jgi:hypothetical protein
MYGLYKSLQKRMKEPCSSGISKHLFFASRAKNLALFELS